MAMIDLHITKETFIQCQFIPTKVLGMGVLTREIYTMTDCREIKLNCAIEI